MLCTEFELYLLDHPEVEARMPNESLIANDGLKFT